LQRIHSSLPQIRS